MHPILFHVGGFAVHTYSVALAIAFVAALALGYRLAKARAGAPDAIDPNDFLDAGYWMIIWGVIGARVAFVLIDWKQYVGHWDEMLRIWNGGISFHGGLIGGLIALIVVCRRRGISILRMGDLAAAPVMLGYAIGRIGCFFNGCCYGRACDLPWAVRFNDEGVITPPSHPTQIYASILSFIFLAVLIRLLGRKAFDGQVFLAYLILASIERFVMEIWRGDVTSTVVAFGLTDVQFLSITVVLGASIAHAILRRRTAAQQPVLEPVQP